MPFTFHAGVLDRAPATVAALAVLAATAIPTTARGQCVEGCTVIHTFVGESAGDQLGWVSNDVGDLDGDGVHDLVLTAPTNDAGGTDAGRIYVHSGSTGALLFKATGGAPNWWLGHDAQAADDLDGDGVADIIVGSPFNGAGRAIVYSGASLGTGVVIHTFPGAAPGDQFGSRVDGRGDFNGDGVGDVVIGAPGNDAAASGAGRASIYSGADFSLICHINGPTSNDAFGSGVSFVGDLNGDGRDEVAIGAQNAGTGGGLAFVYSWNGATCTLLFGLTGGVPATDFGLWFMDGFGDVDCDGTPDIYVNDYSINRAHVFSGVDGHKIWTLTGDAIGQFGIGRIVPDVNGDGCADLFLAAWIQGSGAPSAGKAFVYSGNDATILETFTHDVAGAGFGFDANGIGDVNGDGRFDYLVTAALDSANAGRGLAYVIAGTIAPPSTPGDLDGDGDVDGGDLGLVLAAWGPCPSCGADLDGNGTVDGADLGIVLANWMPFVPCTC